MRKTFDAELQELNYEMIDMAAAAEDAIDVVTESLASGDDAAEALPETDAAPQAGIPQSGADATDTGIAGTSETAVPGKSETPAAADPSEASASEAL